MMANPPFNLSDWGADKLADDVRWKYGTPPNGNANFAWIQHIIHHLAPTGRAGVVLANGSLSSQSGGEGEIRRRLVEADLVDCIVAMPPQLFYTTQIPVSIWFFNKDKKQKGKTLFIDARNLGTMVTRKLRELTDSDAVDLIKRGDIQRIADTYNAYADGMLKDERVLCCGFDRRNRSSGFYPHAWPLCRYCGARRGHGAVRRKDEASDRRVVEIIRKVARVRSGDWETAGKYRI